MPHNLFDTQKELRLASGASGRFYSLPALERAGIGKVSRLPVSIRIVLESVLRNCDGKKVTEQHVRQLANWAPTGTASRCCATSPQCATSRATSIATRS